MDTVTQSKCERPGQAHVRRMLHLSIWMLLLLFVLTSSTDTQVTGKVTVSKCIGEDAAFWWNYTVTPFYAVEWYFGKTLIATLEESHPQDFLKINNSYKHRFHRLLEENRIGFNLTNVTKNDEGDYTCKLNLKSTSILVEQKGTLNVRDIIHGNLNIICDHNICTCGNPNRSGAYSWVFHDGVGRSETLNTNRSQLNVTGIAKNGSFHCVRHSDCQRSGCFHFTSDIIHGNLNIICDHNICTCGNPNSSGVYSWVFHDGVDRSETLNTNRLELNVTGMAKNRSFHCVRHSDCQRSGCFHFTSTQPCRRRGRALDSMAYCRCDEDEPESGEKQSHASGEEQPHTSGEKQPHASGEEQPHTSGEEQPHTSDSPAHVHPAAVAVPVGLGVIFVVIVAVVIKRKDFPAAGNHVESRSEPPELEKLDVEIKSLVENRMGSQILMKDTEA